ncbi:SWIM zinc finger family protein [Micromonospora sp. LOL_015]|uniref:SWIM zinc finger family protein n=1 Tax=Micromonospora sp. LOL_015 TaxID=3345416 RepID=UPI003A844282
MSDYDYAYRGLSRLQGDAGRLTMLLETSGGATPEGPVTHPQLFTGFLTAPVAAATAFLVVADVAATRYYRPQLAASLDPVVTANGDRLRIESFSGCCGVYARLDILDDGLDGEVIRHGTTNVDVNSDFRRALNRVGAATPLHLLVGADEVAVTTLDGRYVEKQVPLPSRWVRGFAEAQVLATGLSLRAEVPPADAEAVLRAAPRPTTRSVIGTTHWVSATGRGLRPATRPGPGTIGLPGVERLTTLWPVLPYADAVRIYAPADGTLGPVAWEARLPGMRLTLMLSPAAARGFSGEGGVLDDLATSTATEDAALVSALLAWDPTIDVDQLARMADLPSHRVRAALTTLGTAGQVGYDLAEQSHFHRDLPYRPQQVEGLNPRLRAARKLVAAGAVTIADGLATVGKGKEIHTVRFGAGAGAGASCTCLWWAKYQGGRGPCKHVLAARITTNSM